MKHYLLDRLQTLDRLIAVILTLIPVGALLFTYALAESIARTMSQGRVRDREMAVVFGDLESLFRNGAVPVLGFILLLAVLNLTRSLLWRPGRQGE